jgi:hypothetical protein
MPKREQTWGGVTDKEKAWIKATAVKILAQKGIVPALTTSMPRAMRED